MKMERERKRKKENQKIGRVFQASFLVGFSQRRQLLYKQ